MLSIVDILLQGIPIAEWFGQIPLTRLDVLSINNFKTSEGDNKCFRASAVL